MSARGTLIAVVGPSGVGKDSVIDALSQRMGWRKQRRVITRAAELGGEDFVTVTPEQFRARHAAGDFALAWQSHGLSYGIPTEMADTLAAGHTLLVNLSRSALAEAAERFAPFQVLHLTATPETLAERLHRRQRETAEDIARRLARSAPLPPNLPLVTVSNDGPLDETIAACLAQLTPVKAYC